MATKEELLAQLSTGGSSDGTIETKFMIDMVNSVSFGGGSSPPFTNTSGRFYDFANFPGRSTGANPGLNTIALTPVFVSGDTIIDGFAVWVNTALAANTYQLAIYASDENGRPTGNAIVSSADAPIDTTSVKTVDIADTPLAANTLYWLAHHHSGATSILYGVGTSPGTSGMYTGYESTAGWGTATSARECLSIAGQTYGVWPDLTGATFTTVTANNPTVSAWFRVA